MNGVVGAQVWAKTRTAIHGVAAVRGESKLKVAFVSSAAVGPCGSARSPSAEPALDGSTYWASPWAAGR